MLVEAEISEEWDSRIDWGKLADRSVRAAVAHSRHESLASADVEISLKFTSDKEVRALNAAWRGKDKATNVLSFPMAEGPDLATAHLLGDIVLAQGVCAAEAAAKQVPAEIHAAHLIVHGTLHLLGYDHETGNEDAEAMEAVERRALASIGIADPYQVTEMHSFNG
ncbi:MAG: rRNA maturation RNase YbeY [Allosphingosinicella sp.]